ncbi:unnamed protein product [Thlaspi arvense]|uniref:Ribosomal protein L16 n=1 Tax=Thlaspi arvense TaxID=13288 RepID=A0AAU9T6R9_THLAR|nr:unnamed protein product [Thlaspi arvense]
MHWLAQSVFCMGIEETLFLIVESIVFKIESRESGNLH